VGGLHETMASRGHEAFRDLGSRMVRGQSQREQMGEHAKVNQTRVILRGGLLVSRAGALLTNETGGLQIEGSRQQRLGLSIHHWKVRLVRIMRDSQTTRMA
jgi:hypothetical protein